MPVREKFVRAGDWRTLETFWNVTTSPGDGDGYGRDERYLQLKEELTQPARWVERVLETRPAFPA